MQTERGAVLGNPLLYLLYSLDVSPIAKETSLADGPDRFQQRSRIRIECALQVVCEQAFGREWIAQATR